MFEVKLWEKNIPYFKEDANTPNVMQFYPAAVKGSAPCVVIYPGGGYGGRAAHEGEPYAMLFNEHGIHAAVVQYRVAPNRHPSPLADAQRAVKIIRHNAKAWGVDADKILTMGSSAGGHLSASTITFPDVCEEPGDDIDRESCLVNGAILCYPVINVESVFGHAGSGKNLLGEAYNELSTKFSLENYVTDKLPPVFVWHTSNDSVVNVKNSLIFAEKLRECGVKFELHIFPDGPHGMGLAPSDPHVGQWCQLAVNWIKNQFTN